MVNSVRQVDEYGSVFGIVFWAVRITFGIPCNEISDCPLRSLLGEVTDAAEGILGA
jgi:hypothetical protein